MRRAGQSAADTPLLRVSRPVSACSRCKFIRRAVRVNWLIHNRSSCKNQGLELPILDVSQLTPLKCDGKLPACTACEKSGRINECSSANDQFAKGKERRLESHPNSIFW